MSRPVEGWMLGKDRVTVVSYIDGKVETIRDEVCRRNANRDLHQVISGQAWRESGGTPPDDLRVLHLESRGREF